MAAQRPIFGLRRCRTHGRRSRPRYDQQAVVSPQTLPRTERLPTARARHRFRRTFQPDHAAPHSTAGSARRSPPSCLRTPVASMPSIFLPMTPLLATVLRFERETRRDGAPPLWARPPHAQAIDPSRGLGAWPDSAHPVDEDVGEDLTALRTDRRNLACCCRRPSIALVSKHCSRGM